MNNKETIQRALGLIEGICRAAELPENIQSALFDALETIDAALKEPTRAGTIAPQAFSPPQILETTTPNNPDPKTLEKVTDPLALALLERVDHLGLTLPEAARKIGTREAVLHNLIEGGPVRSDSREKIEQWVRAAGTADTAQE